MKTKYNNTFGIFGVFLMMLFNFIFTSCMPGHDTENLYPEVVSEFTYTYDELTRTISFANKSVGGDQYLWEFGDGVNSSEKNPVHKYETDGKYIVKLTVTNVIGIKSVKMKEISAHLVIPLALPIDFENPAIKYDFIDFGGSNSTKVANPHSIGDNTSGFVGKMVKNSGAETWAGSTLELYKPIDFGTNNGFKVKVWSPKEGITVKLKIENKSDSNINYEVDAVTTKKNQWETLAFSFQGADFSKSYGKIVLFFDFGAFGDGATYYFDDIQLAYVKPLPSIFYQETFENFTLSWNNFGGAVSEVVANPVAGGINNSPKVVQTTKNPPETWAGSAVTLADALPLNKGKIFKVKVYSPSVGAVVKLKLEHNSNVFKEVDVVTTVANEWQELLFDFSGIDTSVDYKTWVIFFNFGVAGGGEKYYFDDLRLMNE